MAKIITLTEKDLKDLYDRRFSKPVLTSNPGSVYGPPEAFFDVFLRILQEKNGKRVLDVASGDGRYAIPLAMSDTEVTTIDSLPSAIRRLEDRTKILNLGRLVEITREDVLLYPFGDDVYDGVVAGACTLHGFGREGAEHVIRKMQSATKRGGVVYVSLSGSIERILPDGLRYVYENEAGYTDEEAAAVLNDLFRTWHIEGSYTHTLDEEWPVPPALEEDYPGKTYKRKTVEHFLIAIKP